MFALLETSRVLTPSGSGHQGRTLRGGLHLPPVPEALNRACPDMELPRLHRVVLEGGPKYGNSVSKSPWAPMPSVVSFPFVRMVRK